MKAPYHPESLKPALSGRPSIGMLMDLCEENYRHLLRLAPALKEMKGRYFSSVDGTVGLYLEILEQTPYTTLIHLTYYFLDGVGTAADPDATLRLYHDARQAEVLDLKQHILPMDADYQSPSLDQKWKANLFISKWVSFCNQLQLSFSPVGTDSLSAQLVAEQN